jgi:hypothetical protein
VAQKFQHLIQFPFVNVGRRKWAMAGVADPDVPFTVSINVLRRPWKTIKVSGRYSGQAGFLYDVLIVGRGGRSFDYPRYLQDTKPLHGDLVHICLDAFHDSVRVTIPAILGTRMVNKSIQGLLDWVPNSLHRSHDRSDRSVEAERLAEAWPEYVLGPKNPMSFLGPDMPCSFFMV